WILLAAALCSQASREGHSFLDLREAPASWAEADPSRSRAWPSLSDWRSALSGSSSARVESSSSARPLALCEGRALYLDKYYRHEQRLAGLIRAMASQSSAESSADPVERALTSRLFVIT